ncbi:MAG: bifunctional phosphoribosylaminoimidazolecarboxamide formyltransferase/IMP cyclohydrolase [Fidelibacterota bacterium]|nr:MAG: bifunctional phosphoribosylaminoimidazolecarboxamide formyltransferase/IMP cyclohydrolase [Candidatus Neomarinimicrobiota bacterium]
MNLKRAFISVWDKTGLNELAGYLHAHDFELISTGGTAKAIESWGLPVMRVEEITGQPALMDGRVKTVDLRIFGPILADLDKPGHAQDLAQLGQAPMNLVVVNLYPFQEMVQKGLCHEELLEYIDIGGPSLLRAAAKNYKHVLVLHRPDQYADFQKLYEEYGDDIPQPQRKALAVEVFQHTAAYDARISEVFSGAGESSPGTFKIEAIHAQNLRYGENPHQQAAFYLPKGVEPPWKQLHGKELSFNNYADLEAAGRIVAEFEQPAAVIVKHGNPCGFAIGKDLAQAYRRALTTDPLSSFGGIVGLNRTVDEETAHAMAEIFLECIIAPSFSSEALNRLTRKKNLRLLESAVSDTQGAYSREVRTVAGGYLIQQTDSSQGEESWEIVSNVKPSSKQMHAMRLGWKLVRFVKSNAIVFTNDIQLLGVGAGQMSRVDSVTLAGMKAGKAQLELTDAVMASDAFFPFPDGIEEAARLGVKAVIQPGGSVRDEAVIDAANTHRMAMIFTHTRHFRH